MNWWTSVGTMKGQSSSKGEGIRIELKPTLRLICLEPVNMTSEHAVFDDARDLGAPPLDVVVEENLVELVRHVQQHLEVGSRVELKGCRELVDKARQSRLADMAQVRDRDEDADVLREETRSDQKWWRKGNRDIITHHVCNVEFRRPGRDLGDLDQRGLPGRSLVRREDGRRIRKGDMHETIQERVEPVEKRALDRLDELVWQFLVRSRAQFRCVWATRGARRRAEQRVRPLLRPSGDSEC